jgi:iron complex transport system ATP-binding protein
LLPAQGDLTLDGTALAALAPAARARRIGYLAQGGQVHWPLSVARLVALGRLPHLGPWTRPRPADAAAIDAALAEADVAHLASRSVASLSGGERARALLARVLAGEPDVLLADEPVAGLDPYHQLRVMDLLSARAARGCAVVVVLHDLALALRYCQRVTLLVEGRVLAAGPPRAALSPAVLAEAYGVRATIADIAGQPHLALERLR